MGDLQVLPGDESVTAVAVPVTCPRCGRPVRVVERPYSKSGATRDRRLLLACVGEFCQWEGALIVQLYDGARAS